MDFERERSLVDEAAVAEITGLLPASTLAAYPTGTRVIVRRERPHPGAQLDLFEQRDDFRYTGSPPTPAPASTPSLTPATAPTPGSRTASAPAATPASADSPAAASRSTRRG
jgi:hypothetical protein